MIRALVTNDDGIDSPGLHALARAALDAGVEVTVAAPSKQSSGASASIIAAQAEGELLLERRELPGLEGVPAYAVEALPGHIVLAATRGWLDPMPDVVLSGINHGANVGRVVLHSGTVGAVLTASVNGVRGLAVSLDVGLKPGPKMHWSTAAAMVPDLLSLLMHGPSGAVLNLNVPDRPPGELRELRVARLARFGAVQTRVDRVADGQVHLALAELEEPPEEGSDSALLAAGHPTLTALDSVREASGVESWLRRAA